MKTIHCPSAALLSLLLIGQFGASAAEEKQQALTVICVRHAEKVDASEDPKLSPAGRKRAQALARMLRNANIQHVHSSDFIRTRNTASPTARSHNLKLQLYNPRELPSLVKKLRKAGGRHLVVGHSNTTPALVEFLGGKPFSKIDEPREYDRLYLLNIGTDGQVQTTLLRYGQPYLPANK